MNRPETRLFISVNGLTMDVTCATEEEIARQLSVDVEDIAFYEFGVQSVMWLVRSYQDDPNVPTNRAASHALRIHRSDLQSVRGPVVVHHRPVAPPRAARNLLPIHASLARASGWRTS